LKILSKDRKNYNIYSIKSPGSEGLAWAFKISSQALSHGLWRALALLGLAQGFRPGLHITIFDFSMTSLDTTTTALMSNPGTAISENPLH